MCLLTTPLIETNEGRLSFFVKKTHDPRVFSISLKNRKEHTDMKKINPYDRKVSYGGVKGAFLSVLSELPETWDYTAQPHSGFAIRANFPWLGFVEHIIYGDAESVYQRRVESWDKIPPRKLDLMYPSDTFLKMVALLVEEAEGGGYHEIGHVLMDMAGYPCPHKRDFDKLVLPLLQHDHHTYRRANLFKWQNVLADIRLERRMGKRYPATVQSFFAIQRWVHRLEAEVRGKSLAGDYLMALRDMGKGWRDEFSEAVYAEYSQEARDLVEETRPIWEKVLKSGSIEATAHLPLTSALELVNYLKDLWNAQEQEQKNQQSSDRGEPSDSDEGSDSSEGSGSEGDDDMLRDLLGENGEDSGDGDDSDEGSDSNEDSGDGEPFDSNSGSASQAGNQGSEMIRDLLEGVGEALDPGSAMEKQVRVVEKKLGHKIYDPSNDKVEYRKLGLK